MTKHDDAVPRPDSLRLAVAPTPDDAGGTFQVQVYVNDVEMTSEGAGLGMDPYDLLVPTNRLRATPEPHTVPIAMCDCGTYGCGATDVTITRDGDRVRWEWLLDVPMERAASFAAAQYDAEVERAAGDHSWETPERAAGRLVMTHVDHEALRAFGLTLSGVVNHRHPSLFRAFLRYGDYQIFLDVPWLDSGPEEMAERMCATLARGPATWSASWHAVTAGFPVPPAVAGRSWRQEFLS